MLPAALILAGVCSLATREADAEDKELLRMKEARPGVVRIRWRNAKNPAHFQERNAVVVRAAGWLLMAGRPVDTRLGALTATLWDGRTVKAQAIATDPESTLTLLWVNAGGDLQPLEIRPKHPSKRIKAADRTPANENETSTEQPVGVDDAQRPTPPEALPIGMRVVMLTGEGHVAGGALRDQDRHIRYTDPRTRRNVRTVGLIEASMAITPSDIGSPWLDENGDVAGLAVGGVSGMSPQREAEARDLGLKVRLEPSRALAVPASVIRVVLPLLIKHRHVQRAWLGIRNAHVSEAVQEHVCGGLGGHLVQFVHANGAAAQAGMQQLDIIVSIDGVNLRAGASLQDQLLPYRPGTKIRLGVLRKGRRLTLEPTLGRRN